VGASKTATFYFHRLRGILAEEESNEGMEFGKFEINESYFGARRKGQRGRGVVPLGPSRYGREKILQPKNSI